MRVTLCRSALAALLLFVGAAAAEESDRQPNIVFIFCDDLTCQSVSAYGESRHLLETPNIDRLAEQGMLFRRCLVTNSICGPSRASILTGKYSHKNGFYNNSNSRFDSSQQTFPRMLQAAGYQTAMIGKWHLVTDPVGFDFWHILPGQGVYYNPPMIRMGERVSMEGYTTDLIGDLSIEWLKHRDRSRPFLLMSQHKAPHREWSPALRHLGWDNDRIYPEPATLFDDYEGRSLAISDHDMGIERTFTDRDAKLSQPRNLKPEQLAEWNRYYEPRNQKYREAGLQGRDLVRWRYNRYMHDYLACVKAVDENVGRLMTALEEEGVADNTIVVFTSDQGFFLGEHGWFDKRWIFEESLRSPLMVRWPGTVKAGSECSRIVSLIDFAETFLDVAGLPIPDDMQGRSILPVLRGQTPDDWRTSLYYHYYEFPAPHRVRPHRGVITDRYKLVHYYKPDVDDWELLDRQADPLEVQNFYNDPTYSAVVRELHAELQRLQVEVDELDDPPRRAYGNQAFAGEADPPSPRKKAAGGQ